MKRRKIDWLRVETVIRKHLRDYADGAELFETVLRRIDNVLADETGRGNELPAHALDWESSAAAELIDGEEW